MFELLPLLTPLVLIFFNDVTEQVHPEIIKYADDNVLFFHAKELCTIEELKGNFHRILIVLLV